MGKIIAIANGKGGVGKSTVSQNLSVGLKKQGYNVLLVDSDIQLTTTKWRSKTEDEDYLKVITLTRPTLHKDLKDMKKAFDYIIIDGASKIEELIVSGIKAADIIIMPVKPSGADVEALKNLVDMIKTRQEVTDGYPQAFFLINDEEARTVLAKTVHEALEEYELPILNTRISHSTYYPQAISGGFTVYDVNRSEFREKAQEFDNLITEIKGLTNG